MSKKRQERERCTRSSKGRPDHLTIDSIIGRLDVQEGNDRMVTMVEKVGMHKLMETHGLVKSTTTRTESTLGKIKNRGETGQKGSKGELKEFAENRGKGYGAVIGGKRGITFLEDRDNLGMAPKRGNKGPLPAESEEEGEDGSNQVGDWLKHFSTNVISTRSFTGGKLADV